MLLRNLAAGLLILAFAAAMPAQERRSRIDVEHYVISAEIDPSAQSIHAVVQVRFLPLDDGVTSAYFELNNALNVSRVTDGTGRQLAASRSQDDFSIRVSFPDPLPKSTAATLTFAYEGVLTGSEGSPIAGVRLAAIHDDYSFLMYPARWFPVNGYTTDRFTYEMNVTVPAGNRVIASGLEKSAPAGSDKVTYSYTSLHAGFPGSIAVVKGDSARIVSEGVTTSLYFRGAEAEMAGAYGQETGKVMGYLTEIYGLPPQADLTLIETENGAPNGYASEGIIFLSPRTIGKQVNTRVLVNQAARQWWGAMLSASSRDHLWITNGAARYSEILYIGNTAGAGAADSEMADSYVEALTVDNPPLIQTSRLEDYSPEFWALTGAKGAAVFGMLRSAMGDANFEKLLKEFPGKFIWQSVNTGDFRRAAEEIAGANLQYFFIEWIESSGAPEFKMDYTVFRTQKNFRIVGKISQDMDTFRMPVEVKVETDGNPEEKQIEVVGTSSEFAVETFGRPRNIILDPNNKVLHYSESMRTAVAIRRGEQYAEVSDYLNALKEYQRALEVNRNSSLAHYRIGETFFQQDNYQQAANEFREALNGDLEPKWTEVWAHINLGKIFDVTGQRERARNEFQLAIRTKDNTQGAQEEAAKYIDKAYVRPGKADR
jgi:tetratricopeptide (TPR) repeat protein